ncbi:unnamed protein product [Arctogadus glacialis]
MSTAVEAVGFVLCIISWLITGTALGNDYWKVSTVARQHHHLVAAVMRTSGTRAPRPARASPSAKTLSPFWASQACRGLMIVALLMGLACLVIALLGVKCIKIGSASEASKASWSSPGASCLLWLGVCTWVSVSWYANMIVEDFYDPFTGGIKFELTGLYMAGALGLPGHLEELLCCACKRVSPAGRQGETMPASVGVSRMSRPPRLTGRLAEVKQVKDRRWSYSVSSLIHPATIHHTDHEHRSVIFKKITTDQSTASSSSTALDGRKGVHTKIQGKLLRKLVTTPTPSSSSFLITCLAQWLQPGPHDSGKQCAVEFEIKAFSAESQDAKIRKRSAVKLMLRKVQSLWRRIPSTTAKPSRKRERDQQLQQNIKNIIVSVDQVSTVVLYCNDSYVKSVAIKDSGDAVSTGASLQKVYTLLPLLADNKERRGIALDGKLKHEDTNLASSSLIKEGVLKEVMGILVTYRVMVKLIIGG